MTSMQADRRRTSSSVRPVPGPAESQRHRLELVIDDEAHGVIGSIKAPVKFLNAIAIVITKNLARESVVILSDGREIIRQADPEAVREFAVEIAKAIDCAHFLKIVETKT